MQDGFAEGDEGAGAGVAGALAILALALYLTTEALVTRQLSSVFVTDATALLVLGIFSQPWNCVNTSVVMSVTNGTTQNLLPRSPALKEYEPVVQPKL